MDFEGQPLCSIGIPTYNRPVLLAKTLQEVLNQSYPNLEIIISDNASPDADVAEICHQTVAIDKRIRYFRQTENIGPSANFEFVFRQATGIYFMWAADDDRRSLTYVEKLIAALQERPAAVLCGMEACYETADETVEFFPQYSEIYSGLGGCKKDRILKMIAHLGTANIIYGLFRRDALLHQGVPAARWIGKTLNEHPLFVLVADKGDVVCLPEVGLWKRATTDTVEFARWHAEGGFYRRGPNLRHVRSIYKFHRSVMGEIDAAIEALDLPQAHIAEIRRRQRRELAKHAIHLLAGWKPQRVSRSARSVQK